MDTNGFGTNDLAELLVIWGIFGGSGYGRGNAALTNAEMQNAFNTQSIISAQQNQSLALANDTSRIEAGQAGVKDAVQNNNFDIANGLNQSRYDALQNTNSLRNAIDSCCCTTNLALCNQTNTLACAIHNEGEATRSLFTQTRMRDLESQLNRYQTTADILGAQGRYVPYAGCGYSCPTNCAM